MIEEFFKDNGMIDLDIKKSSKNHEMELVKYIDCKDFKDETCYKCNKKIGEVDIYQCKEDKELYHEGCLDKY